MSEIINAWVLCSAVALVLLPGGSSCNQPKSGEAPSPEKRALLVGISKYDRGNASDWWNLDCETDLNVLKEVLVQHYGFEPGKIRVLHTAAETTHQAIVEAFRAHLVAQSPPNAVIYFHFSGHGSRTPDPARRKLSGFHQCLVPSDYASRLDHSKDILDDEIRDLLTELKNKRRPLSVTLTFDSCYSGTVSRSGRMLIRGNSGGPAPGVTPVPGGLAHGPGGLLAAGEAKTNGYVAIAAAGTEETAKQTTTGGDHPKPIGCFTFALTQALIRAAARPEPTYQELFDDIAFEIPRLANEQHPQLEGNGNQVLFQGVVRKSEPYVPLQLDKADQPQLPVGQLHGATQGSVYAIYPKGTTKFAASAPVVEATVKEVKLSTSLLEYAVPPDKVPERKALIGARAIEKVHQYGDMRLKVDVAIEQKALRDQVLELLRSIPLASTDGVNADNYDLQITDRSPPQPLPSPAARQPLRLVRKDGSLAARVDNQDRWRGEMRAGLETEARWQFVQRLENTDPTSTVRICLRIVAVDTEEDEQGQIKLDRSGRPTKLQPRAGDLERDAGGNHFMTAGEHLMFEVTNQGSEHAWVSVLHLRPDGRIGGLFPHPEVKGTDNKIPAHTTRLIPYPIVYRVNPGAGFVALKVIATNVPTDFTPLVDPETLRQAVRAVGAFRGRTAAEKRAAESPLGQLLMAVTLGRRDTTAGICPWYWATDAVTIKTMPQREGNGAP
jgi:hypothetical protein